MDKSAQKQFLNLEITKKDLQNVLGDDLYNAEIDKPITVHPSDVISVINSFLEQKITLIQLVEWVNVIWFTDLYLFLDNEADSILSVLEVLETFDEEDVNISNDELYKMVECLSSNKQYE